MKKNIILIVFILISAAVFGQTLSGVHFLNSTGYDIKELYVSPTSHDDWYDDLLKGQTVSDGESVTIAIPDYEDSGFLFDAMAVDVDGDQYSRFEIDLSSVNDRSIEFTFDDYDDEYADDDYYEGDYDTGYTDGYKDAFRDAYSEAFKEGYQAGFEAAQEMQQ
ncbi:MAG: hypothetical protein U9N32_06165 [Spirochaetota bacterium]|nr:hypothetical protein [Spirochaetota bacterium]